MKGAAIKIEHLVKTFPDGTRALRDISFEVAPGEFLVIIGLSGSGKSTLMRCINRMIEPTSGKIYVDGVDITTLSQEEMRRLRHDVRSQEAPEVVQVLVVGAAGAIAPAGQESSEKLVRWFSLDQRLGLAPGPLHQHGH